MHSTLLLYNQRCFTIKTNTSDGCFRKTFSYNGKRYSVRVKTARDLWHKVEEKSSGYLFYAANYRQAAHRNIHEADVALVQAGA